MKMVIGAVIVFLCLFPGQAVADTQLLGPVAYKSFSDSPFNGLGLSDFQLEDFEDGLFDVPDVTASDGTVTSIPFAGRIVIDSVDGDDGNPTDGICFPCDSYWSPSGTVTFTFGPNLPTHAGVVWTDGMGTATFEAFDQNGNSLGVVGPAALGDAYDSPQDSQSSDEDHFFGVIHIQGISAITISNSIPAIEIDHLQFNMPAASPGPQLLGPIPYKSFADSPFNGLGLDGFQLEDFEDGLFDVTGVTADRGIVTSTLFTGRIIIDSVDGDDGDPTNGTCFPCDSFWDGSGSVGITFSFGPSLPTHVGLAWTDGLGTTTFEAFDRNGDSLGVIGPVMIADHTVDPSQHPFSDEDHFFGVIHDQGISAVKISNTSGGVEIDHLQFNMPPFDSPAMLLGPSSYKSFDDSPFKGLGLENFQLEDFEDGLFNLPGVTASDGTVTSIPFSGRIVIDSVDGDDGDPTDGICFPCDSYWSPPGTVTFSFGPVLPTHAGVAWTDGDGNATFEAFDPDGNSLGIIGPVALGDGFDSPLDNQSSDEDHFFGVVNMQGISAITISNSIPAIEIDHLQFNLPSSGCIDTDGDGYGLFGHPDCPAGEIEDCDDSDPEIRPDAPEQCNGADSDCNGLIDEDQGVLTCGTGACRVTIDACIAGEHATCVPGSPMSEVYDGIDNDCDGEVDDGLDDDGDGIPNFRDACNIPVPPGTGVGPDGCPVVCIADNNDDEGEDDDGDDNEGDDVVRRGPLTRQRQNVINECRPAVERGLMTHAQCTALIRAGIKLEMKK